MGKFSEYVSNISYQTNILRDVVSKSSGIDCSSKNIAGCANVVSSMHPSKTERYQTPDWFPDIVEIVKNAPQIGGRYPIWGALVDNSEDETPFYYNSSTLESAVNYARSTCGRAVLCSDMCDNDINKASAETLIIGDNVHTWDKTKDISDPSGNSKYKVRWYVIYSNTLSLGTTRPYDGNDYTKIEQVFRQGTNGYMGTSSQTAYGSPTLKRLVYLEGSDNDVSNTKSVVVLPDLRVLECYAPKMLNANALSLSKLELAILNCPQTWSPPYRITLGGISSEHSLDLRINGTILSMTNIGIYGVEDLSIPDTVTSFNNVSLGGKLKTLTLPINLQTISNTNSSINGNYLKKVKIPRSLKSWATNDQNFNGTPYVELYEDFDLSSINFTGRNPSYMVEYSKQAYFPKSAQWLKDLCIWLKDRTGEEANTIIIGPKNLGNAQRIWLTFNPNDKRDITWVPAGTEGAINIVQFITEQLNWTVS